MSLQNGFNNTLNILVNDCHYYRSKFGRSHKRNTIEGAFGYNIIDKVYRCCKTLLKPTYKTQSSIQKRLESCLKQLTTLAVELDVYYRPFWANYIRKLANLIISLLPQQFIQLSLFDNTEYITKTFWDGKNIAITKQPVFDCFKQWLNRFNSRKFERDLQRYLNNPNFSYYADNNYANKNRFCQLSIPRMFAGCFVQFAIEK